MVLAYERWHFKDTSPWMVQNPYGFPYWFSTHFAANSQIFQPRQDLRPDYSFGKAIWEPALKEAAGSIRVASEFPVGSRASGEVQSFFTNQICEEISNE